MPSLNDFNYEELDIKCCFNCEYGFKAYDYLCENPKVANASTFVEIVPTGKCDLYKETE